MQDEKNRQSSLQTEDKELMRMWVASQQEIISVAYRRYEQALDCGIAKEVARKLLPEGLTMSRLYMNGTLRSWLHYVEVRTDEATQKEHRVVAEQCAKLLEGLFPTVMEAFNGNRQTVV
jgi:thymidylate synthase (FAD)